MLTRCCRQGMGAKNMVRLVVLVALLLPVILAIGSIVVDVGNWYVLKRRLQTQVDAAALAAGGVANGCDNPDPARSRRSRHEDQT